MKARQNYSNICGNKPRYNEPRYNKNPRYNKEILTVLNAQFTPL